MKYKITIMSLFLLLLSACGKEQEEFVYISNEAVQFKDSGMFMADYHSDKLYYIDSDIGLGSSTYQLNIKDMNTGEIYERNLSILQNENPTDFCVNVYEEIVLLTLFYYENTDSHHYEIKWLDKSGQVLRNATLQDRKGDINHINAITTDALGNVVLITDNKMIYVYSPDGIRLHEMECEAQIVGYGLDVHGRVAIGYVTIDGNEIASIDVETGDLIDPKRISSHPNGKDAILFDSDGNMYIRTQRGIDKYQKGAAQKEEIIGWVVNSIDSNDIQLVTVLPNGNIFVATRTYVDMDTEINLYTFEKTNAKDVSSGSETNIILGEEKTVITLVTDSLYTTTSWLAVKFNETDSKYKIEIKCYDEEGLTREDRMARINADIVTGGVIDMMDTSMINYAGYADKGILADFTEVMKRDDSLNSDNYLMNIIDAYEYRGGRYAVPFGFSVEALFSDGAMLNERGELTLEGVIEYLEEHEETEVFHNRGTRSDVLRYLVACGYEDYVNRKTGEANFNSPEFIDLLELCKEYGVESRGLTKREDMLSRKILFAKFSMFSISQYQFAKTIYGNDMIFTGFPTQHGEESMVNGVAISVCANSKHLEGAWEFIRFCLEEEQQKYIQEINLGTLCPVLWSEYEAMLEKYSTPIYEEQEDGTLLEVPIIEGARFNNEEVDIYALSKEEVEAISEWFQSLDIADIYNDDVMTIIEEEASAFFFGDLPPQTVASNIQNRVQMLLYEGM